MTKSATDPDLETTTDALRNALDGIVGYHLRRASVNDMNGASAALEPAGGRPITMSVLLCITETPGRTSADLCRALGIKRANIVSILQELETKGLFVRRDDPSDQRIQRLYPTEAGVETTNDWLQRIRAHEDRMLGRLSQEERAELRRLLQRLWSSSEED